MSLDLPAALRGRRDLSERPLAPGELAWVHAFVNTVDLEHHIDELATPEALADWLRGAGLLAGEPAQLHARPRDLERALALRRALRALLLANAGLPLDPEAPPVLDRAAREARLTVRFDATGRPTLRPHAGGVPGALGRLVVVVYDAIAMGTWARLKACPRKNCHCAFYDRSRNASGVWCNMGVCGSREKAAAYYRRHGSGRGSRS